MSELAQGHLRSARRKLRAARSLLADELSEEAAAAAYFAMLSAARAALADRGQFAKTHNGTWKLFAQFFVKTDLVEKTQYDAAQRAMELRVAADYWGGGASAPEAQATISDAESFVQRVSEAAGLLDDDAGGGARP
ncbi:MAG: HEPN domain-containing protein [Actinomycetota bacterium]|nr:HEPN domain-containing protein [Actinomycetota bacterium]